MNKFNWNNLKENMVHSFLFLKYFFLSFMMCDWEIIVYTYLIKISIGGSHGYKFFQKNSSLFLVLGSSSNSSLLNVMDMMSVLKISSGILIYMGFSSFCFDVMKYILDFKCGVSGGVIIFFLGVEFSNWFFMFQDVSLVSGCCLGGCLWSFLFFHFLCVEVYYMISKVYSKWFEGGEYKNNK